MTFIHPDDAGFTYATDAEFDRQASVEIGYGSQDRAWVLTDRDAWYPNPYYRGPAVPHPEDDAAWEMIADGGTWVAPRLAAATPFVPFSDDVPF